MVTTHLFHGDCRDYLQDIPDGSFDSIVTDPPYELAFMGKKWDATGIAYNIPLWAECLRVLKPGGHLLAFGGTRTYHRMACAIEDAGFEIRDSLDWIYGTGFPKSLNISKALDKAAGVMREVTSIAGKSGAIRNCMAGDFKGGEYFNTSSNTVLAQQWGGWGTALKPAHEPIVMARKPLDGTVAHNITVHGVGGLNIDECRIETSDNNAVRNQGRWPANIILSEEAAEDLDQSSGTHNSPWIDNNNISAKGGLMFGGTKQNINHKPEYRDAGGASRFFYVAKTSRREREAGCESLPQKTAGEVTGGRTEGSAGLESPRAGAGRTDGARNHHPTVKPITLMRHLVRMITPPNGTVFDPFVGSGSTGCAAVLEGMHFVGCDLSAEYITIAHARIEHWKNDTTTNTSLFGDE